MQRPNNHLYSTFNVQCALPFLLHFPALRPLPQQPYEIDYYYTPFIAGKVSL